MKKNILSVVVILFLSSSLMGCADRTAGTLGGAALGGVAGNVLTGGSTAGTVVGAVGGGLIGNAASDY